MSINYLSENIIIEDDKLYQFINNKKKLINNNNWHNILKNLGWYKLPKILIKFLNLYLNIKNKNSLFGVIDCGGNGDCLFNCLSHAFNSYNIYNINYEPKTSNILRKEIADSLDIDKFNEIIYIYKILKDTNEFDGVWDPYNITFEGYKKILQNNLYWADHILIDLFINKYNINIIILYYNECENQCGLYNTMNDYKSHNNTIILLYENKNHYKLIGYFNNNNMISFFNHRNLPNEIKNMIKK